MMQGDILVRNSRLGILVFIVLAGYLPAKAQDPWLQFPRTPALPPPERSGTLPVNGVRIWYAEFGSGTPVILLHGGLANSNYWGLQVPALAQYNKVIVMDSRGHGRSTWDGGPISYHQMAEDVVGLMDGLHIPKAAVVGWSDGAIIGLDLAIHHPGRLTRLYAFAANSNTAGVKNPEGNGIFEAYKIRTRQEYQKLSRAPQKFNAFAKSLDQMWNTEPSFTDEQLCGIRVPTWIVDGDRDELIKREDTDRMARLIPGAGELILPRTSHFAFLQDPKQFNEALLHFLSRP
jgi:pimeloyl-ACP methyl ester carboxylesterase